MSDLPLPLSDPRREGGDSEDIHSELNKWLDWFYGDYERANYSDPRRDGADSPTRRDDWRYINHERKHKEKET